jgi:serpin B
VETLDLAGDPEGSRDVINSWVADQTNDLIPELLPEGFIQPSTLLVLTDAVYYEAQWQTIFGKYGPVDGEFSLLDGSTVDVSYLHEKELFDRRGEGDGFRGAELPYVGGDFSMLLIVPDRGRFEQVRSGLSQALLDEIDQGWLEGSYELYMPKWEDSSNLDLLPWLAAVGVAPGSYPAISPDAFLGAAVHGADIAVDEWGTVAAAATGMGFFESAPGQPDFTLEVDRPFLYLIRHRSTGAVLFAGQVMNPTS